jgi:hypothetical protein
MDLSPADLDAVTRTALSEGGVDGDAGLGAVAAVVKNRLNSGQYGDTPANVVHAPGQFSAWALAPSNPNSPTQWSASNPQYQRAAQIVSSVFSGDAPDPTGGATYYGNLPVIQASGKGMPAFTKYPQTAQIGKHTFFADPESQSLSMPSQSDIADTAGMLGVPKWQAVSSGGGVTISVPVGSGKVPSAAPTPPAGAPAANVSQDDLNETAKMLGINNAATAKGALPPNFTPADLPAQAPPEIRAAAGKIVPTIGLPDAMVEGMPIVGPAFNAATAATGAAIQPFTDPNAAPTFGQRFSTNLAIQNEAQRQWDALHPMQAVAGNFAGGGMLLGPFGQSTIGAALLGLPNATRMGASVGGRIYSGMAGGAGISAADAALRGQDPITGAEIGGAGGAIAPVIGEGVGNAITAISNATRSAPGALSAVNPIGRAWLSHAIANETPASIAAAQDRMGPQGFLADLNPALTELAAGVANRPEPPASSAVGEAYRTRSAAQRNVTETALNSAFGNKVNIEGFKNAITENRAAVADPLYEQWRSMKVTPTPALKALIPRLQSVGAFDEAEFLGAAKGIAVNQKFFTPGAQKEFPTTETWDLVKRGLDSKIEQAYAGGNKTRAAVLLQLKGDLIDEIGRTDAGQVWRQARSEFADRSALLDNVDAGRDTFLGSRSGLSVDQMREELRGLSGPELAARIVGARSAADEVMGATRNGDTTLRNKFLAPNNQDKLRLILGDQRANDLIRTVEQQDYLAGQAKYVNPRAGSPSAPRTAAIEALEAPAGGKWNPSLTQPLSFIPPKVIDALRPSTILQGSREATYAGARQQIVPALLARGNALSDLIRAIREESTARSAAAGRGSVVARNVTAALSGPGSTTARLRGNFRTNPLTVSGAR